MNFSHFFLGGEEVGGQLRATSHWSPQHYYFLLQNRRCVRCSSSLAGGCRTQLRSHEFHLCSAVLGLGRRCNQDSCEREFMLGNKFTGFYLFNNFIIYNRCFNASTATVINSNAKKFGIILDYNEAFREKVTFNIVGHFNTNEHFLTHSSVILHQVQHR